MLAGHSLGEYTALAVAGVLDAGTAVFLARERGRLMHQAGQETPGGMVAVLGFDEAELTEVCRETGARVVNINCPGQLVISGPTVSLTAAVELVKSRGSYRTIPLHVSGAFHTPLIQSAVDGMTEVIATLPFREPAIPIIGNTTARPLTTADEIKEELLRQLCDCVQWQPSVEYMIASGVDTFIEIGPGKVLTGLIKRISKDVTTLNIGDAAAVREIITKYGPGE
ncbi:ACP S-malonyltransferase [Chloroflexota bacterium]